MNEWTNKEGQKVSTPECRVAELTLLGGKPKAQDDEPRRAAQQHQQRNVQGAQGGAFDDMDDDIPFAALGACGAWRVI